MSYSVNFRKTAFKQLSKISEPSYSAIKFAIINLQTNPRPSGYIKLKGRDGFRIRAGSYRIIYEIIDKELIINIIEIGHRKSIYNK